MVLILTLCLLSTCLEAQRPCLTLTEEGVAKVKEGVGSSSLFDSKLESIKKEVDQQIDLGFDVPIPKDMAGGYTHERHKFNYKLMHKSGNLYQFTGDEKYAKFVKDMLFVYAEMYPKLPVHPTQRSYATGKIFWQCLNDANWLVFTSQAYDCIYNYLSSDERKILEKDLFIPFANFLSEDNPRFFNRIHNHSTWANAAVGLMALAMKNDELLDKALYGLKDDGINPDELDNDGGYIKKEGVYQAGFLAQLDYSFSPEGYFSEGPYYQRYAIFPFLVFSHALENNKPELKIFEYRDNILQKATMALLHLTDPQGNFFAINDAQKGMNFRSYELVTAVDLMYSISGDDLLLDWAAAQDDIAFNETGFIMSESLKNYSPKAIGKKSVFFGDGVDGDEGGIAVMRIDDSEALFKFSAQGMGHGHFDRLSYSLFDAGGEVLQDYGAVRWVNLDQKGGGRYLPENKTFGKQTIGHNTIVVNQKSQYDASVKKAEEHHPELYHLDLDRSQGVNMVSAIENNVYANVDMQRTVIMYADPSFINPLLIDIFSVKSDEASDFDLPFWYQGHFMKSSFECEKNGSSLSALGEDYGYQHIWKESSCKVEDEEYSFNWFANEKFYTITGATEKGDEMIMGRAGANDPNFNLRSDPVLIHRKSGRESATYFNVIESHGEYNRLTEIPNQPLGQIEEMRVEYADERYVVCSFKNSENIWQIYFSLQDNSPKSIHEIMVNGSPITWDGVYKIVKSKK